MNFPGLTEPLRAHYKFDNPNPEKEHTGRNPDFVFGSPPPVVVPAVFGEGLRFDLFEGSSIEIATSGQSADFADTDIDCPLGFVFIIRLNPGWALSNWSEPIIRNGLGQYSIKMVGFRMIEVTWGNATKRSGILSENVDYLAKVWRTPGEKNVNLRINDGPLLSQAGSLFNPGVESDLKVGSNWVQFGRRLSYTVDNLSVYKGECVECFVNSPKHWNGGAFLELGGD